MSCFYLTTHIFFVKILKEKTNEISINKTNQLELFYNRTNFNK